MTLLNYKQLVESIHYLTTLMTYEDCDDPIPVDYGDAIADLHVASTEAMCILAKHLNEGNAESTCLATKVFKANDKTF